MGTSYYYDSPLNYRRYAIKGYFDDASNSVVWWDDLALQGNADRSSTDHEAMMAIADFNCPGEGIMRLDGSTSVRDNSQADKLPINLQKTNTAVFADEWDFVISNYTQGANDPMIIDSVAQLAGGPAPAGQEVEKIPLPGINRQPAAIHTIPYAKPDPQPMVVPKDLAPYSVEEKFKTRTRNLQMVIPVSGDSIELRFYDDAEIDGDSIAVFLNGQLLRQHILLSDRPYTMHIAVSALAADNELVMVAENLGSIPPNTSLMVAIVSNNRYEAYLHSTEGASAMVRLVKAPDGVGKSKGK